MAVAEFEYSRLDEEGQGNRTRDSCFRVLATLLSHPWLLLRPFYQLVPSFIQTLIRSWGGKSVGPERKIRNTSFLDGMRGYVSHHFVT
jgi:hypothetical protein